MINAPVWEVNLVVYGSITVEKTVKLNEPKGLQLSDDPFYSDIEIKRRGSSSGIEAIVTAYAPSKQLAREAAILYFGQMLDALAIRIDQPLYLNFGDRQRNDYETHDTLRRVKKEEWHKAFKEARLLAMKESTFLRALGWYRKGLYTEDPFDKFLAFWNSIEIVATKYHPPIPEGRSTGSISKIWESFKSIWGECDNWDIIQGQKNWIDDNYKIRIAIAHGTQPVDIETVKNVVTKIDILKLVANKFLTDWRQRRLNPEN
ncbi:MAG TPA: methylamine utilization protein MauJ [Nostocaceae cyanobacterium]|nr:methylamine utilization protein MauJ [Nostocaceae cyanobacterium]